MTDKIILASASPRRRNLLSLMGLTFEVNPSKREEVITKSEPDAVVEELSFQKAEDIAGRTDNGLVIGSDTVVTIDGKILGKPATREEAIAMIRSLSGRVHEVYTGVTLIERENGRTVWTETFSEKADVKVMPLSEAEIEGYVDRGESMDKAGAYGIQGYFSVFVEEIKGEYATVLGLPVAGLYRRLRSRGGTLHA